MKGINDRHQRVFQGSAFQECLYWAREKGPLTFLLAYLFFTTVLRAGSPCNSDARLVGADRIAKQQASLKGNSLTNTGAPNAGPGGNTFFNIAWLAQDEARPSTPGSSSSVPNLVYFPNLKDALKSHMHAKHRLGYADCKTGYYTLPELATSCK
eukprot:1144427-Pelagomonas_calceolata.AAC.4